ILEILVETGLIGLVLFLLLLLYGRRCLGGFAQIRNDPRRILIALFLVNTFINAMISGDLLDNRMMFAMIGLMLIGSKDREPARSGHSFALPDDEGERSSHSVSSDIR
ncbi:MAG: hypothetical protein O3A46_14480, partial [Candidatus Poribacteria bacterium]|nr:hypothetical protein [Candidatus Poribacteria bacterium]